MIIPKINLLVLRAADLEITRTFYEALGMVFIQEKHGTGPIHYSCDMNGTVLEIYPGKPGIAPDRRNAGSITVGFQVTTIETTIAQIGPEAATVLTMPQDSPYGRRAVLQDPDGRAVELSQTF